MGGDELYHFGVKGMRWGVRKEREPTVKSTSANVIQNNIPKSNPKKPKVVVSDSPDSSRSITRSQNRFRTKKFVRKEQPRSTKQSSPTGGSLMASGTRFAKSMLDSYGQKAISELVTYVGTGMATLGKVGRS